MSHEQKLQLMMEVLMKRIVSGLGIAFLILGSAHSSQAQTPQSASKDQQPLTQELLGEVRQLRIALQNMSVNAYRGQILLERLRLQQDQVGRASRELSSVRNEIGEMKSFVANAKDKLDDAEKQFDKGVLSTASINEVRNNFQNLKRREEFLNEREAQLSIEVDTERTNLNDLNKRLDALEREIVTNSLGDDAKKSSKK